MGGVRLQKDKTDTMRVGHHLPLMVKGWEAVLKCVSSQKSWFRTLYFYVIGHVVCRYVRDDARVFIFFIAVFILM